ncbi:MAG: hypothetical protein R6V03_09045 [Kiritimatiellia bacterium]
MLEKEVRTMRRTNQWFRLALIVFGVWASTHVALLRGGQNDVSVERTGVNNSELLRRSRLAMSTNEHYETRKLEAILLMSEGKFTEGVSLLEKAPEKQSDSFSTVVLAELQMRKGEYGKGVATLKKAIEQEPQTGIPYVRLGEYFLAKQKYSEAKIFFERALEMSPDLSVAYLGLLRIDRMTLRRDLKRAPEYCSRILIIEEKNSLRYREAIDHLKWLISESATLDADKTP